MLKTVDQTEGPESAYRAYRIGDGGRIETSTDIFAEDDKDAIEQARQLVKGHVLELWDRGRKLITLRPPTLIQPA